MIILSFLAGMKVLKIFKESSARFESFGWDKILRLLESRVRILDFLFLTDHFVVCKWFIRIV